MRTTSIVIVFFLAACGTEASKSPDATISADAKSADDATAMSSALGAVVAVNDLATCPNGAPAGATCKQITVKNCPGIESEAIDATLAILPASGTVKGTVTHWIGGGGDGFYLPGATEYQMAGYRQVFVSWNSDWEQTQTSGIKTAACRPATVLKWIFDEPSLHAGSQATAFCGEGHSGGSAQLAFALSHFGLDSILDYVSERAGPPFARIDLGCDHGEPATATVCGDEVTMYYSPSSRVDRQNRWENTTTCGSTTPLASDVMKWNADSISVGGTYNYPNTELQFFDCTYNAPAVTGMAQIYYDQIVQAEGGTSRVGFHCYKQADGCSGEGLGPHGDDEAIRSMIEKCVPNHL